MKAKPARYNQNKARARTSNLPYPYVKIFVRNEAKPVLAEIKRRESNDRMRKILVNYLIVRAVSIFEYFLLNEAGKLADLDKTTASELFTFVRLDKPIGDQVVSTFSFTNLKEVDHVFSTLKGIDFLNAIKKESTDYYLDYYLEDEQIPYTKSLHKNWDNVMRVFDYRHDIVHHNKLFNLSYKEIRDLVGGTLQFLMCSIMVID